MFTIIKNKMRPNCIQVLYIKYDKIMNIPIEVVNNYYKPIQFIILWLGSKSANLRILQFK